MIWKWSMRNTRCNPYLVRTTSIEQNFISLLDHQVTPKVLHFSAESCPIICTPKPRFMPTILAIRKYDRNSCSDNSRTFPFSYFSSEVYLINFCKLISVSFAELLLANQFIILDFFPNISLWNNLWILENFVQMIASSIFENEVWKIFCAVMQPRNCTLLIHCTMKDKTTITMLCSILKSSIIIKKKKWVMKV